MLQLNLLFLVSLSTFFSSPAHFRGAFRTLSNNYVGAFWKNIEAALQRCSYKKMFWKYTANLQKNAPAEVWFQQSCLQFYWNCTSVWVFSCNILHIFRKKTGRPEDCFWKYLTAQSKKPDRALNKFLHLYIKKN